METKQQLHDHWHATRRLMIITLTIWFVFAYVVHWFGHELSSLSFIGFPLDFYMAAQGSLVVFVVLIFWFADRQNAIDASFDLQEEDE